MVQAAIFDVDGTLVDSVDLHAEAWQRAFRRFGKRIPFARIRSQIGKGADQLLPVFLSHEEIGRSGEEISRYRSELYRREYLPRVRPFPCVRELFERIRSTGARIALATSSEPEELEANLRLLGIEELVEGATSSEDADRSKPHSDVFEAALAQLPDVAATDAIAVGDTPYDAEAAGKLGLRTIGLLSGGFAERDLRAAGAVASFRDPADLLARFVQSPLA